MGMVLAEDVAHHACRLDVPRGCIESQLVHGVENASLHRFLAVCNVGERPPHDDAHRIFEIAPLGERGQWQRLIFSVRAVVTARRWTWGRLGSRYGGRVGSEELAAQRVVSADGRTFGSSGRRLGPAGSRHAVIQSSWE